MSVPDGLTGALGRRVRERPGARDPADQLRRHEPDVDNFGPSYGKSVFHGPIFDAAPFAERLALKSLQEHDREP